MSEERVAQAILATCHENDIVLGIAGEKLTVDGPESALTPDLLAELRQHKAGLLDILKEYGSGLTAQQCRGVPDSATAPSMATDTDIVPCEECVEPPGPCQKCGSLMVWWDLLGGQHCTLCEEPRYSIEKAAELREVARRLRDSLAGATSSRQGR
jgi:hypothetical protein